MPNGTYGGVRGRFISPYSIAPDMGNNLVVKVHYALGSRKH